MGPSPAAPRPPAPRWFLSPHRPAPAVPRDRDPRPPVAMLPPFFLPLKALREAFPTLLVAAFLAALTASS